MLYIATLFDPGKDSRPLYTATYDADKKQVRLFPLYLPKTGFKLSDIWESIKQVSSLIASHQQVYVNDYKQHLLAFNLIKQDNQVVYDYPCSPHVDLDQTRLKKILLILIKEMQGIGPQTWTKLRASAAVAYKYLQSKGVIFGYERLYPMWHMDTYSGRTRTTGFNVQGLEEGAPLSCNSGHDLFINFDWISADFRMASILSQDDKLSESFAVSDPYQYMADAVNEGTTKDQLTRDESKASILQSLYSLDPFGPAMQFYSKLGSWMLSSIKRLDECGHIDSILGRRFTVNGERTAKSAFNATIQGSIVHAMQSTIANVLGMYPDNLLLESHDSLVLTSKNNPEDVKLLIKDVADVMCHPFRGILEDDPAFPVAVSIGTKYKVWKRIKRFNG